jgi:N-acetylmuramoyl-L-alanine amidase
LRGFIFLRVLKFNKQLIYALIIVLLVGCALYPFYVSYQERRDIEVLSWSVASKAIVIDPGHGGIDPGCVGKSGIEEKNINLAIATRLAALLRQAGAVVVMTREGDYDLGEEEKSSNGTRHKDDLVARVEMAEEYRADLFISIHVNSIPLTECWGAQVFYHPSSKESKRLASLIQKEFIKNIGESYRWVKPEDFFVLRSHKYTSVIVEAGFLSNPREETLLSDPNYQNKLAWCIYAGIVRFFAGDPMPKEPVYED